MSVRVFSKKYVLYSNLIMVKRRKFVSHFSGTYFRKETFCNISKIIFQYQIIIIKSYILVYTSKTPCLAMNERARKR